MLRGRTVDERSSDRQIEHQRVGLQRHAQSPFAAQILHHIVGKGGHEGRQRQGERRQRPLPHHQEIDGGSRHQGADAADDESAEQGEQARPERCSELKSGSCASVPGHQRSVP